MATAVGIISALLAIRRRYSRDGVAVAHDKAERSSLASYVAEAEAARKDAQLAWDERNRLVGEVGRLQATNEYLVQTVDELRRRVRALEHQAKMSTTDIEGGAPYQASRS